MKKQKASVLVIVSMMILVTSMSIPTLAKSQSGGTTTYSGRAIGVSVTAPIIGTQTFADTGQLPSSGGFISATPVTVTTSAATANILLSVTMGFNSKAESQAAVADVVLLPGTPDQITADVLYSQSVATCSGVSGFSDIASLTLGGNTVVVSGAVNQTVSVPGVLTLVINQQETSRNSITVNALHLTTSSGIDVVVSSASSDISCALPPPPPKCLNFVTGGGWISVSGAKDSFGFNAGLRGDCQVKGHLEYYDHANGIHISTSSITSYGGSGNTRTFSGQATVNGQTVTYTVTVVDNDSPKSDQFTITLSNGYSASGTLSGGNIEIHT